MTEPNFQKLEDVAGEKASALWKEIKKMLEDKGGVYNHKIAKSLPDNFYKKTDWSKSFVAKFVLPRMRNFLEEGNFIVVEEKAGSGKQNRKVWRLKDA